MPRITFEHWKARVNAWLRAYAGIEADMIPDFDYAKAYAEGKRPSTAAAEALKTARPTR